MIHSDLLNLLIDDEKVILLACVQHATGKEYQYDQLPWIRKPFLMRVLEEYYHIIPSNQKKPYKQMVEKINPLLKLL